MKAIIVYGPSGSGKSTKAEEYLSTVSTLTHYERVERDLIRFDRLKLGNWKTYKPNSDTEYLVDAIWKFLIVRTSVLEDNLIISDTLCKANERRKTIDLLKGLGYTDIHLTRMDTPLVECIRRDALRGDMSVGEDVIRKQREHFIKG